MRITVLMPGFGTRPSGGNRVHYEYANRLSQRGHTVTVTHPITGFSRRIRTRLRGPRRLMRWFTFAPGVSVQVRRDLTIPCCDVCIVGHWSTAAAIPAIRSRARAFVQIVYDYEYWMSAGTELRDQMASAFRLPDMSIATSGAVAEMLTEAGRVPDALIPCGLSSTEFGVDTPPEARGPVVGLIARPHPFKRVQDAFDALDALRARREFRVLVVGRDRIAVPDWAEVIDATDDHAMRAFYNRLAVFVLPSEFEGWGLPAAEAMACGAAVVSTRNGGVEDFLRDRENAMLVPPCAPDALSGAIDALLDSPSLRHRLVQEGLRTVTAMDWNRSVDALEAALQTAVEAGGDGQR